GRESFIRAPIAELETGLPTEIPLNPDDRRIADPRERVVVLEASNLSKRFGGIQALDQVGLTVCAGEVLALIGENGAGKSTLVKILTGIYRPDGGAILLSGVPQAFANAHA